MYFVAVCACSEWVCIGSWQTMGLTPMCPLRQQRIWTTTSSVSTPTNPLYSVRGYVCIWRCVFFLMPWTLPLNALYIYREYGGLQYSMWHYPFLFFLSLCLIYFGHWTFMWTQSQLLHTYEKYKMWIVQIQLTSGGPHDWVLVYPGAVNLKH